MIEDGELRLGQRRVPLLSGEIHFFRTEPHHWDRLLESAVDAGLPIVSTYLSWRRHEPRRGAVDLSGTTDPRLDVRRFVELCAAMGLLVHLKPGPWICAEEDGGGLPGWLLEDRDLWALDAAGQPILGYNPPWQHRVPSYLHPRYLAHAGRWLRAVDRHLAGLFYPDGPIILVQLDNEPSYAFHDAHLGFDYHPVVIERFRRWLLQRYGSPGAIGDAWAETVTSLGGVDAPRAPEQKPSRRGLDWVEFREWLIGEHLRRLRRYHETAGIGGAVFTANYNDHPIGSVPQDGWRIARAIKGTGGPDLYYVPPLTDEDIDRMARSIAIAKAHDPALPWAPEIQAGIWRAAGQPTVDPMLEELELWWLAAVAFGLRGLNLYMLADRENWADAPLRVDGSHGPLMPVVQRLAALIRAIPGWGRLAPVSPVALYRDQDSWRRSYMSSGSKGVSANGRGDPVADWNGAFSLLLRTGYFPVVWDSRSGEPTGMRAAIVAGPSAVGPVRSDHLRRFAERGGLIIEVEPRRRAHRSGAPRAPKAERVSSADQLPGVLDRFGIAPPVIVDDPDTLAVLARSDESEVLFLVRRASEPATTLVRFDGIPRKLKPLNPASPDDSSWSTSTAAMHMSGRAVRVFRVEGSKESTPAKEFEPAPAGNRAGDS